MIVRRAGEEPFSQAYMRETAQHVKVTPKWVPKNTTSEKKFSAEQLPSDSIILALFQQFANRNLKPTR